MFSDYREDHVETPPSRLMYDSNNWSVFNRPENYCDLYGNFNSRDIVEVERDPK